MNDQLSNLNKIKDIKCILAVIKNKAIFLSVTRKAQQLWPTFFTNISENLKHEIDFGNYLSLLVWKSTLHLVVTSKFSSSSNYEVIYKTINITNIINLTEFYKNDEVLIWIFIYNNCYFLQNNFILSNEVPMTLSLYFKFIH